MDGYNRESEWIKLSSLDLGALEKMNELTEGLELHTVCESACCPNRPNCFGNRTATFLILGDTCTRNCSFCAVNHGKPVSVDANEPAHLVEAVKRLGLDYVVVTSVTRDDLEDGGAFQFVKVIEALRGLNPEIAVEVLIPDFRGSTAALKSVVRAQPGVLNHNVETVSRLYSEVRPQAQYRRSLELLRKAKELDPKLLTKSGFMLGLGESLNEVIELMRDLRQTGCDILTIGQYLQPSEAHHELIRYVAPEEFEQLEKMGLDMGFPAVVAAPLVRSSYRAAETYRTLKNITTDK